MNDQTDQEKWDRTNAVKAQQVADQLNADARMARRLAVLATARAEDARALALTSQKKANTAWKRARRHDA